MWPNTRKNRAERTSVRRMTHGGCRPPCVACDHASDRGSRRKGGYSGAVCGEQAGRGRCADPGAAGPRENEKEMLEHIVCQMETERGLDRAAAIADMRFNFIEKVCRETVVKPKESREHVRSTKIDRVLTGKYTALPCFAGLWRLSFS